VSIKKEGNRSPSVLAGEGTRETGSPSSVRKGRGEGFVMPNGDKNVPYISLKKGEKGSIIIYRDECSREDELAPSPNRGEKHYPGSDREGTALPKKRSRALYKRRQRGMSAPSFYI